MGFGRLVFAGLHPRGDSEPVPGVDRSDGKGQVGEFIVGEVGTDGVVDTVLDMALSDQGDVHGFLLRNDFRYRMNRARVGVQESTDHRIR